MCSFYCIVDGERFQLLSRCPTIPTHSSALVDINFNWILPESCTHFMRQRLGHGHKNKPTKQKRNMYMWTQPWVTMITISLSIPNPSSTILLVEVVVFYSLPDPTFFHFTQCFVYLRCTYLGIPAEKTYSRCCIGMKTSIWHWYTFVVLYANWPGWRKRLFDV